jgi:hypothetical protein
MTIPALEAKRLQELGVQLVWVVVELLEEVVDARPQDGVLGSSKGPAPRSEALPIVQYAELSLQFGTHPCARLDVIGRQPQGGQRCRGLPR